MDRSPGAPEGSGTLLDFRLLASKTDRQNMCVVLNHPVCGHCLGSPRDTKTCGNVCPWWPVSPSEVGSWV